MPEESPSPGRLRLRVTATAESILRGGHPWLFADSVREQNRDGRAGELVVVYDRQDRFLAIGLFDPDSPIRMRVLHAGKPVTIDDAWWRARFRAAIARRAGLFDERTNGYRCIHGESDGWPGLVLDRYDDSYVLKLYSAAWMSRLPHIAALVVNELAPGKIVLRLSRNIEETAGLLGIEDGQVHTPPAGRPAGDASAMPPAFTSDGDGWNGMVTFLETGLRFEADLVRGQKTGFFLDQRENRRRVEGLARDRDVLNAFSFSGGFSLYSARGGARSVTDLDISPFALDAARRNFALNAADPAVARCRHETVTAEAFVWLERQRAAQFDMVILDPPSLARRELEREGAIRAYTNLARRGIELLRPGGVLVASSCSAHVTAEEFFEALRDANRQTGRPLEWIDTTGHPADHPATFDEGRYLKTAFLKS
ncbi:MAG: rRNA (cytosine1962-C5)-methyltransferase [Verrucomicrobiota bacterium]|jgi:23S rRNA (cytosine1962-C5)-methyltransferase